MLRGIYCSIQNALGRMLFPEDARIAANSTRRFEMCMGLRPFQLIYREPDDGVAHNDYEDDSANDTPRLVISKPGLVFCIGHATIFVLSGLAIELIDPKGALAISDDALAYTEVDVTSWLHCTNALMIFVQLFLSRRFEYEEALLQRRFERHLRALGADTSRAHRSRGIVMMVALGVVLVAFVSQYGVGALFLKRTVLPDEQRFLWVFSVAVVMPILYIELIMVQFSIRVASLWIRARQLNDVMAVLLQHSRRVAHRKRMEARGGVVEVAYY